MKASEKKAFQTFLLAEYEHIAKAHFTAVATTSEFFKNYLAIVGLPLSVIPIALQLFRSRLPALTELKGYEPVAILGSLLVATMGFCMMLFIISLRNESLLYARTVNGVRNYFYCIASLDPHIENTLRALPRAVDKPRFFRKSFLPTIVAFGILDGAYPAVAIFLVCKLHALLSADVTMRAVITALGLSALYHIWAYWAYTRLAEGKPRKLLEFRLFPPAAWIARLAGRGAFGC